MELIEEPEAALRPAPDRSDPQLAEAPAAEMPSPSRAAAALPDRTETRSRRPWLLHGLIFASTLLVGLALSRPQPKPGPAPPPAPTLAKPPEPPRSRLEPEFFDALHRLRESAVVGQPLEEQFLAAQAFYRENNFEAFFSLDPWKLSHEQLYSLHHFCEHGFLTAEREILVLLLENELAARAFPPLTGGSAVLGRLEAAAAAREQRLVNLRLALQRYQAGRAQEVVIPGGLTPEQDQALRALVVQKLAEARQRRDELDRLIQELQIRLGR